MPDDAEREPPRPIVVDRYAGGARLPDSEPLSLTALSRESIVTYSMGGTVARAARAPVNTIPNRDRVLHASI